jgi:metallo-beta-lactamase class B
MIANRILRGLPLIVLFLAGVFSPVRAEDSRDANQDPGQFLIQVAKDLQWSEPAEPVKIVGPIHFVGTKGLGVWLITTSDGHIVLNSGMPGSGPMIAASIRKLGFKPSDVKLLLTCHAHVDHVGGHASLKKLTGAKVVLLKPEIELLQSGGRMDFHYGNSPAFSFEPVSTDRRIGDGDEVKLGDVTLTALHTPGHTRGSTTWVTTVTDGGKTYKVVFPDGTSVNPGYRVVKNPSYPGIEKDFRRTFQVLQTLKPDIWLRPHTDTLNLETRRKLATTDGAAAWVDPEGYKKWVTAQLEKFEGAVAKEK